MMKMNDCNNVYVIEIELNYSFFYIILLDILKSSNKG
jgi:hypothetical protein